MRAYSIDLRQRVVLAYLNGEGSQADIARRFNVSRPFVEKLMRHYRATGSAAPSPHAGSQRRRIDVNHEPVLRALIESDNDATDSEIAGRFEAATGVSVSARTITGCGGAST